MIFSRTYRYKSALQASDIKTRLLGKHVKIHNMDFEVSEKDDHLRIIPHAERIRTIKTLPITHVDFKNDGTSTQIVIKSKMRKIDSGGPLLIVIFCAFMFIAAVALFKFSDDKTLSYPLLGISLLGFTVFWIRMQSGYFDYVRKLRDYIKQEGLN